MAASDFTIDTVAVGAGAAQAEPGATVNLALVSTSGVKTIAWSVQSSSDASVANPAIATGGSPDGQTATFTMSDPDRLGHALRIRVVTNSGDPDESTTEGIVGTAGEQGLILLTLNEALTRVTAEGWLLDINKGLNSKPFKSGVTNTTDATATTIATITTVNDRFYFVHVKINSRDGGNLVFSQELGFKYDHTNSVLAIHGVDDTISETDDASMGNLSHAADGNDIVIKITGKAAAVEHRYQVFVTTHLNKAP